ncbi:hypothetical protein LSAT2_000856 [Lamellibrachia satsuma]|nr:hypothetical protein LSAT2_000856 [Lamellibrachia satsuma]
MCSCWSVLTKIQTPTKKYRWCLLVIFSVVLMYVLTQRDDYDATPIVVGENAATAGPSGEAQYVMMISSRPVNRKEGDRVFNIRTNNKGDRERAPGIMAALLKNADEADASQTWSRSGAPPALEHRTQLTPFGVATLNTNDAPKNGVRSRSAYSVIVNTRSVVVLAGRQSYKRYAVFSANSNDNDYTYSFLLPLTAMTWRRIGYGSVVVIVGNLQEWRDVPLTNHILESTLEQGATVVFLQGASAENSVMLSQTSRLFAAALIPFNDTSDTALVTSDADIWPMEEDLYSIQSNITSILSINAFCCGNFQHKGSSYRMLPLTNIVASVATWRMLIRQKGALPSCPDDIVAYFSREFGELARRGVRKGENNGWFMDQHMASLWLADWHRQYGNGSVRYVRRDIGRDRIDSNRWFPYTMRNLKDAHVLLGTHTESVWRRVRPLLKLMYGPTSTEFRWCEQYRDDFLRHFSPI